MIILNRAQEHLASLKCIHRIIFCPTITLSPVAPLILSTLQVHFKTLILTLDTLHKVTLYILVASYSLYSYVTIGSADPARIARQW